MFCFVVQPKQINDIRDFLQKARRYVLSSFFCVCKVLTCWWGYRKDAKNVKIKKGEGVVKFKIRCSKVRKKFNISVVSQFYNLFLLL